MREWTSPCGRAKLWNAKWEDVLPSLADDSVALVVTSPPYNLKKKWWDSGANGIHVDLAEKFSTEWYDDEVPEDLYQKQQQQLLAQCKRISYGSVCYNHKVRHAFKRCGRTFHPIEWTGASDLWCEIIWDRGPGPAVNCRRPTMADERILVFGRPSSWHDLGLSSIWRVVANKRESRLHPCAFPIEIPARCILSFTDVGDAVFDPYSGSGTTVVAALRHGRTGMGCEAREDYFNESIDRISAELESTPLFVEHKEPETMQLFGDVL